MSIILAQSLKTPRGAELPNRLAKAARTENHVTVNRLCKIVK